MQMRPFTAHGVEVSQCTINKVISRMKAAPFTAANIQNELEIEGVPKFAQDQNKYALYPWQNFYISSRAADRIIRHFRTNLVIETRAPKVLWRWQT